MKDEPASAAKNSSSAPAKGASSAAASAKAGATVSSGPVTEEEIRAVLMQKTPVTTQDLVAKFKSRLKSKEVIDNLNFIEVVSSFLPNVFLGVAIAKDPEILLMNQL